MKSDISAATQKNNVSGKTAQPFTEGKSAWDDITLPKFRPTPVVKPKRSLAADSAPTEEKKVREMTTRDYAQVQRILDEMKFAIGTSVLSGTESRWPRTAERKILGQGYYLTRFEPFPASDSVVVTISSLPGDVKLEPLTGKLALAGFEWSHLRKEQPFLASVLEGIEALGFRWLVSKVRQDEHTWDPCGRYDKEATHSVILQAEMASSLKSRADVREWTHQVAASLARHLQKFAANEASQARQQRRRTFTFSTLHALNYGFIYRHFPDHLSAVRHRERWSMSTSEKLPLQTVDQAVVLRKLNEDRIFRPLLRSFEEGGFRWKVKDGELLVSLPRKK